jgi:hypothetical protein
MNGTSFHVPTDLSGQITLHGFTYRRRGSGLFGEWEGRCELYDWRVEVDVITIAALNEIERLRSLLDELQQWVASRPPTPVYHSFVRCGRSMIWCNACGHPAWEHDSYASDEGGSRRWPISQVENWLAEERITVARFRHLAALQRSGPPT